MPRFSHVAVTVGRDQITGAAREQLLRFYGEVFDWRENADFAIPGERIFLRAPTDMQYLTIRGADRPMQTSGYEHLGVWVETESELRAIHARAAALAADLPDLELRPVESLYDGNLLTFRVRFRLPLTLELQHLKST